MDIRKITHDKLLANVFMFQDNIFKNQTSIETVGTRMHVFVHVRVQNQQQWTDKFVQAPIQLLILVP